MRSKCKLFKFFTQKLSSTSQDPTWLDDTAFSAVMNLEELGRSKKPKPEASSCQASSTVQASSSTKVPFSIQASSSAQSSSTSQLPVTKVLSHTKASSSKATCSTQSPSSSTTQLLLVSGTHL
nr:covalently-linked cell wall protein 14-like [Paramormyrops kingsleyae]